MFKINYSSSDELTGLAVDVGTPKQTITVIIDTGSWELLLNPNCASAADSTFCTNAGHYNSSISSSSKNLTSRYYVSFGTGSYVGDYFSDTLWLGDNGMKPCAPLV